MARTSAILALMLSAAVLTACTEPQTYPATGEECTAEDPVKSVDPSVLNCLPEA